MTEWRGPGRGCRGCLPGPTRCACPTSSSRDRGRIRSASGWPTWRLRAFWAKRSTYTSYPKRRNRAWLHADCASCIAVATDPPPGDDTPGNRGRSGQPARNGIHRVTRAAAVARALLYVGACWSKSSSNTAPCSGSASWASAWTGTRSIRSARSSTRSGRAVTIAA